VSKATKSPTYISVNSITLQRKVTNDEITGA
jgi:hypothetical protein